MGMIRKFCTDAVLLHQGRLVGTGTPDEVADQYQEIVTKAQERYGKTANDSEMNDVLEQEEQEDLGNVSGKKDGPTNRPGTGEVEIQSLELLDKNMNIVDNENKLPSGSVLTARAHLRYHEALEDAALSFTLYSKKMAVEAFATNTEREEVPVGPAGEGDLVTVDFSLGVPLRGGPYTATATAYDPQVEGSCLDYVESEFKIKRPENDHPVRGLVNLPATVKVRNRQGRQGPSRQSPSRFA